MRGTLQIWPEELSKGELTGVIEESDCDEKDKGVPEEVMLAKKNSH